MTIANWWAVIGALFAIAAQVLTLVWAVSWRSAKMTSELARIHEDVSDIKRQIEKLTTEVTLVLVHKTQIEGMEKALDKMDKRVTALEQRGPKR